MSSVNVSIALFNGKVKLSVKAARQQHGEDQRGDAPSGVAGRPSRARPSEAIIVVAVINTPNLILSLNHKPYK